MAVAYQLLYLVGLKPWERGGVDRDLARFLDLEEQTRTPPYGRALDLGCGTGQQTVELAMPHGMPYKYDPRYPTNYIYIISISSSTGFVPMFENGANDSRFLGVMVQLIPTYGDGQ